MSIYKKHQKYYDTEFLRPDDATTVLERNEIYFQSFYIKKYKDVQNPFTPDGTYYTVRRIYDDTPNTPQHHKVTKEDGMIYDLIEEIYEFRKNKL